MGLLDLFEEEEPKSVSEYTAEIKRLLEGRIQPGWVTGEVSNLRRQSSGHIYFSLKDAGAQLPAVMFRGDAVGLEFVLQDGMEVMAFGQISVYEPHGRYQLVVRAVRESGKGRLYREFERLKRKLAEEGLFAAERKRPMPVLPLRVAIVTSPTGAALQDFLRILKRRQWSGLLRIFPAIVQGRGAASQIAASIELVNRVAGFDLLVLARGGGSIEDLWCFNEEVVARAVARSRIPVLSAIGHEIDFTLCDFAADIRAETPSGAAELVSSCCLEASERVKEARRCLMELAKSRLESCRNELQMLLLRLRSLSPSAALEKAFMQVDDLASRLEAAPLAGLREKRERLDRLARRLERCGLEEQLREVAERGRSLSARLERALERGLERKNRSLENETIRLQSLSPRATLSRGYAMLERSNGRLVTGVEGVVKGERLRARLSDGRLELEAKAVEPESVERGPTSLK